MHVETSHRSVASLSKASACQTFALSKDNEVVSTSPLVFTSSEVVHTAYALDGKRSAVFRAITREGKTRRWVEIVRSDGLKEEVIEVGEDHGSWYLDGECRMTRSREARPHVLTGSLADTFGPPSWHPDGHSLLYTAELLPPTDDSKFAYAPTFGEKFPGSQNPALFLLVLSNSPFQLFKSTSSASLHQLTGPTSFPATSFGQALFLPDLPEFPTTPQVLATGYSTLLDGRKLGLVYCANRPAGIYELLVTSSASKWEVCATTCQTPPELSCRSPRILYRSAKSNVDSILVFLSNKVGGPHSSCAQLHATSLTKGNTTILVPIVERASEPEGFPGLYVDQLPRSPFVLCGSPAIPHVVLTSIWGSRKAALSVNLRTGEVKDRFPPMGSAVVLGTDGAGRFAVVRSTLCHAPYLAILDVAGSSDRFKTLSQCIPSPDCSFHPLAASITR